MNDDENRVTDFDTPWKEAIDASFESFMAFFFPDAHAGIDWSRGYERLDKELRKAIPHAEAGNRVVDFLAKVWRNGGEEEWVLVHAEVQSSATADFAQRMYVYNSRLYGLGLRPVASFAILADERPNWRPSEFGYTLWGCRVSFAFPIVKLADLDRPILEASENLFATVVLAHLETRATQNDLESRRQSKFALVRRLYDRGLSATTVRLLFRVIDWMMSLGEVLEAEFWADLNRFEQERQMPYVTSVERIGIQKGLALGRAEGLHRAIERRLRRRFGDEATALMPAVQAIVDETRLDALLDASIAAATPADFLSHVNVAGT